VAQLYPWALGSLFVAFYDSQGYHMGLERGEGGEKGRECTHKSIYKAEVSCSAIMYVTYELVATGKKISNIYGQEQQMAVLNVIRRHV
jgi:hypothetical protein